MKGWLIIMMELSERVMKILERNDISLCGEISERHSEFNTYDIDLETFSPEGEDVIISLIYNGTEEDFINQFRSYAEDFDAEEHAEMWIGMRGNNGVPNSIVDLLEDAEWQKEMLLKVARELDQIENMEFESKEPITKDKFMEYIEKNFTLNKRMCLDLLDSIFDYAERHNCSKYNYTLEELIINVLDLSDNEKEMLFRVE